MPSSPRSDRIEAFCLDLVLVGIGGFLGLIGTFLIPLRLAGGVEGLAAVIALVGNVAVGLLGGIGGRSTRSATLPGVSWFVVVMAINVVSRGGDVIIPGKLPVDPGVVWVGYAFLALGLIGAVIAISATQIYTRRLQEPRNTM
ncbi:MAG TPA: hypothetical protein VHW92_11120 [Mycobacteriales bacterium]|nr:hypothetical protein [Mycobacteriales bacterium]